MDLLLKAGTQREGSPAVSVETGDAAPEKRRPLRCRGCGALITYEDRRISVDGQHEHMRVNPAAYVFRFGCFSEAEGARISGEPTEAYSWFEGCRWQYAQCKGCGEHLGWSFDGRCGFFGLLLEKLVADPGESS